MGYTEFPSYGSESYALSLVKCGFIRRWLIRKRLQLYQFKPTYELSIFPRVGMRMKTMEPYVVFHYANLDIALTRMKWIASILGQFGCSRFLDSLCEVMCSSSYIQQRDVLRAILNDKQVEGIITWEIPLNYELEHVFLLLPEVQQKLSSLSPISK